MVKFSFLPISGRVFLFFFKISSKILGETYFENIDLIFFFSSASVNLKYPKLSIIVMANETRLSPNNNIVEFEINR